MYICDLHNDFFTNEKAYSEIKNDIDVNCRKVICAVYKGKRSYNEVISAVKKINKNNNGNLLLTAFEDIDYLNEENIDEILSFKPIYLTLTWNYENSFGYGCYNNKHLKQKAFKFIKKFNKENICIDTAHLSKKGFFDVAEKADTIINSHTCFNAVNKHKRNIDDEQIKIIIQKKGIIGVTFVTDFLTKNKYSYSEDIVKHISYFVDNFGDKNLCIGSDFFGTDKLPKDIFNYKTTLILVEKLFKMGYNYRTIEKIFYKNFEDFLNRRGMND
jgi:membrane dipeptidase